MVVELPKRTCSHKDGQDEKNDGADDIYHESYGRLTPYEEKIPQCHHNKIKTIELMKLLWHWEYDLIITQNIIGKI
jgi:hypothetical protein